MLGNFGISAASARRLLLVALFAQVAGLCLAGDLPSSLYEQAVARASKGEQNTRGIGGSPASFKENPWQSALLVASIKDNLLAQFCGGTIISDKWILTAAHCIDTQRKPDEYHVLIGTDSLQSECCRLRVARYVVHPGYQPKRVDGISKYDADVALIRVADGQKPLANYAIQLDGGEDWTGKKLVATGWGVTERRYQPTINLVQVVLPIVDRDICNLKKSYDKAVTANMLCAGFELGKVDTCQGDSGGPGTVLDGGNRRLVGVISWGHGCGTPFKYGVYTRVAAFREWIAKNTNEQ